MRLATITFLLFITSVCAEEGKFTRAFHSPPQLVEVLKTKYEGKNLKELLSNAGANLDDEDAVIGPNGAGVIVRSTINNLDTVEEIIKSCIPLQTAFHNPKLIMKAIISNEWDFSHLGLGTLKFNADNTAVATLKNKVYPNNYRWVLTKQNLIEFRTNKGKMLFTAVIFGDTLHIQSFHSKPSIEVTVRSIK